MALTPRLDLRQTQSLAMTPQLQQAIKLLQLSAMELAEYVELELERNPLLEREEGETGAEAAERDAAPAEGEAERDPPDSAEPAARRTPPAPHTTPPHPHHGHPARR